MRQIPPDGKQQSFGEGMAGHPAQFCADLGDVHGIAPVMAWSIRDELDQLTARRADRLQLIQHVADRFDNGQVRWLVSAADIVGLARLASGEDGMYRLAVILNKEPVADLLTISVNRQRLSGLRGGGDQ